MAENESDPARDTQQFRLFAQQQSQPEQVPPGGLPIGLIVGVAAIVVLVAVAVVALMI
ncbi:hypothetical protein ABGB12_23165 [Actinocorallia sp. B10E7]|uniref:hypothetical protein n=1 Tax=Actinocorallia sp. B10E7 TaxID=3153558 RepID=UPI00325CF6AD